MSTDRWRVIWHRRRLGDRFITVVITLVVAGVLGVVGTALTGGALIKALGGVQETDLEERLNGTVTEETVASMLDTKISAAMPTALQAAGVPA